MRIQIQKNGYITGSFIILTALMLGTVIGGSLFTYSVYRKHTHVLEWARESEMQARMAEQLMRDSAEQVQALNERITELEAENADLRDRLPDQATD